MLASTLHFALRHRRGLTFGAMLMALSSFGQTYCVSLFGAAFRAAFGLSDGTLGAAYAAGTVCSALTLTWPGRLTDLTPSSATPDASPLCSASPACRGACGACADARHRVLLPAARRSGADVPHRLDRDRARLFRGCGKAIGTVSLGFSIAQAVLPPVAVLMIG